MHLNNPNIKGQRTGTPTFSNSQGRWSPWTNLAWLHIVDLALNKCRRPQMSWRRSIPRFWLRKWHLTQCWIREGLVNTKIMKNLLCLPLGKPEPYCPQNALRSYKTTDATCSGITLVNFGVNTSKTTCCPEDSLSCGGCQVYSSGKCEKCLGGYRLGETCEACANTLGWTNELGQTCDGVTMSGCNDRPVTGQSSNQACCICGGGTKSPTPFMYPDKRFALGDEVMLKPLPRTARRYSLNADCGLGAHNLTFDGTTGAIYYSSQKPTKAFSVQCEVSAHQAGVSPTVSLFLLVMVVISLSVSQFFMLCFVESQAYSQEHPVSDANFNFGDFLESRR